MQRDISYTEMEKHILLLVIFHGIFSFEIKVPANFYGSKEVLSGYLSNSDIIVEAYSLHPDYVVVCGSVQEVERQLATIDTAGS